MPATPMSLSRVTRSSVRRVSILVFAALLHWSLTTDRVHFLPYLAGGFLAALLWFLVALPLFVQSFVVKPNELELETPYLERNIAFTRDAYGLAGGRRRAPTIHARISTWPRSRPTGRRSTTSVSGTGSP